MLFVFVGIGAIVFSFLLKALLSVQWIGPLISGSAFNLLATNTKTIVPVCAGLVTYDVSRQNTWLTVGVTVGLLIIFTWFIQI